MSGYGLPKTLEKTLNNILQDSQLVLYKIAENGPGTTIVTIDTQELLSEVVKPFE